MARDPVPAAASVTSALRTFSRPWPTMLAGLACTVVGLLFSGTPYVPARLIFLGIGLLIAGAAVARRLQTASWELEDRAESAGLLALGAFVALLAFLGMEPSWDSGRIFLGVLILVALVGSFLVLLPRTIRRIAASILVVLHFGGILTAVTAVAPRNDAPPWLSMQMFTHFYRNYLFFAYLTNAYHFYSPDPGPPNLLWFYVKYDDGSEQWIKLPNRSASPVLLHHQRLLASAESASSIPGNPPPTQDMIDWWKRTYNREYEILPGIPHDSQEKILMRRRLGATLQFTDPRDKRPVPIQLVAVPGAEFTQYAEPQEVARRLLASYARHIARTSPHPEDPTIPVKYVRVYRVTHQLLSPKEFSEGINPTDDVYYQPFYMGKYNADGKLLDPKDPFLFWYLPIARVPKDYPEEGTLNTTQSGDTKLLNCMEIHATQSDKFEDKFAKDD